MSDLTPDAEKLDALDAELGAAFPPGAADPAAPGAPGAPPPGELVDDATMRMILAVPFDFIAARKGAHWKLQPDELAALVPVASKVANKYAPAILAKWADELALAAILGIILIKRVNLDGETAAAKTSAPETAEAAPGA